MDDCGKYDSSWIGSSRADHNWSNEMLDPGRCLSLKKNAVSTPTMYARNDGIWLRETAKSHMRSTLLCVRTKASLVQFKWRRAAKTPMPNICILHF